MARLKPGFDKRGVKVIGLSVDPVDNHAGWAKDIAETQGTAPNFPMIADTDLKVSKLYRTLPADTEGTSDRRTRPTTTTGRNFDEILRVIDSMQLTAKFRVATPADCSPGEDVIITPAVTNQEAATLFPGFTTLKPYLRTTKQPS